MRRSFTSSMSSPSQRKTPSAPQSDGSIALRNWASPRQRYPWDRSTTSHRPKGFIARNKAEVWGFPVEAPGSFAQRKSRHQGGKSMLVRDVMRKTVPVQAEETLDVAALRLKKENVGALPVVEADRIAGMITDRDLLLRGVAGGRSMKHTLVREVMSVRTVA